MTVFPSEGYKVHKREPDTASSVRTPARAAQRMTPPSHLVESSTVTSQERPRGATPIPASCSSLRGTGVPLTEPDLLPPLLDPTTDHTFPGIIILLYNFSNFVLNLLSCISYVKSNILSA